MAINLSEDRLKWVYRTVVNAQIYAEAIANVKRATRLARQIIEEEFWASAGTTTNNTTTWRAP